MGEATTAIGVVIAACGAALTAYWQFRARQLAAEINDAVKSCEWQSGTNARLERLERKVNQAEECLLRDKLKEKDKGQSDGTRPNTTTGDGADAKRN
jgi:hypothetical protein